MSALNSGTQLDDYQITGILGQGGFGLTYLANDQRLSRKVAIKEYFPRLWANRSPDDTVSVRPNPTSEGDYSWGLERFLTEAQMLARFKHPAIVNVNRIIEAHGTAYIVLDYEEGMNLGEWLNSLDSPPTQQELDQIIGPLLDALEMIHSHSILHRDIAPDNIYIRRNGTPVLLDFGSAREAMGQKSHTISAIVKSGYSPVEQYSAVGKDQGPWTDIYALGATLYKAVAGQKPPEAVDRAHEDPYVSASQAATGQYRPGFLAGIDRSLGVLRNTRPQSVAEWRQMLFWEQNAPLQRPGQMASAPQGFPQGANFSNPNPSNPNPSNPSGPGFGFTGATQGMPGNYPPPPPGNGYPPYQPGGQQYGGPPGGHAGGPTSGQGKSGVGKLAGIAAGVAILLGGGYFIYDQQQPDSNGGQEVVREQEPEVRPDDETIGVRTPPGRVFSDCSGCPEMVVLPTGSFVMGTPNEENGRFDEREGPTRTVSMNRKFAMGKYEVTRDQFLEFVQDTNYAISGCTHRDYDNDHSDWITEDNLSFANPGYRQTGNHPVVCVSYQDAQAYIEWLSRKAGHPYRLPTEAEWEYAARAGTRTPYSFGSSVSAMCRYGNFSDSSSILQWKDEGCNDGIGKGTMSVGNYLANGFGLFDMHGNVWEMGSDCEIEGYSGSPTNGHVSDTRGDCDTRSVRGGSWTNTGRFQRSGYRDFHSITSRQDDRGFRVVRELN